MIDISIRFKKCLLAEIKLCDGNLNNLDNYINECMKHHLARYFHNLDIIALNGISLQRCLPEWLIIIFLPRIISHEYLHYFLAKEHDLYVSVKMDNDWIKEKLKDYGIYANGEI